MLTLLAAKIGVLSSLVTLLVALLGPGDISAVGELGCTAFPSVITLNTVPLLTS